MLYYHVMTRCALYRTNWCCFVSTKRCRAKKIMGHQVLLRGRWRALVPAEWCILILYCQRVLLYCIKVWSEFREERETHFKGRHLNIKWNCFFFFVFECIFNFAVTYSSESPTWEVCLQYAISLKAAEFLVIVDPKNTCEILRKDCLLLFIAK